RCPRCQVFPYTTLFRSTVTSNGTLGGLDVLFPLSPSGRAQAPLLLPRNLSRLRERETRSARPSQKWLRPRVRGPNAGRKSCIEADRKSTRLNSSHGSIS